MNGDEDSSIVWLAKEVGELTGEMKGMRTELSKGIETFQAHMPNCDVRVAFFGSPDNPKSGYKYFLDQMREAKRYAIRLTWKQLFAAVGMISSLAAYIDRDAIFALLKSALGIL